MDLGGLDEDDLRRLEVLLRAAREHDTGFTLDARSMPSGLHTFLLIDVQHTRKGPTHHWWLGAEPPCGTHPDPEAACQVLRSFRDDEDPFATYDGDSLEVEMGPAHATVRGFWRGRWHEGGFDQNNSGADISWGRLGAVLEP